MWDAPTVDLFTTRLNKRLPLCYSALLDDEVLGVDSLSASWEGLIAYEYPPTPLILAVLNDAASSRIRLCLIAPCWANQTWFPVLLELLTDHPRRLPEWDLLLWHLKVFTTPPLSSSFMLGDYWVFPPRERLFGRRYQENVSASKGVDTCFL
jgi:hypothetical protein